MPDDRSTASHGLTSNEVADDVVVLSSGPGTDGTSNCVVLHDRDAATVIDTLLLPSMAAGIRVELARRQSRAALVVNTHPHADHVGGNTAMLDASVVAHPVTADSIGRLAADPSLLVDLFPAHADELRHIALRVPEAVDPAALQCAPGIDLVALGPAHTPIDLAVYIPAKEVLIAGDLCFNQITPLALPGHAHVRGWLEAVDALVALAPCVVIPGHGPSGGIEILHAMQEWLRAVLVTAAKAVTTGVDARTLAHRVDTASVAGWAAPGRTALALAVAAAELTGDTSVLPGGIPNATRSVTATDQTAPGSDR